MRRLEGWAFRNAGVIVPLVAGVLLAGGMLGLVLQGDAVWQVQR